MNRLSTGSSHVGFVVDKVALGQVFSEYFGFHCKFAFHRLLHNHHNHLGLVQWAKQWPLYQVNSVSPHEKNNKKLTNDGITVYVTDDDNGTGVGFL
jgi:hypothetical protein